MNFVFSFVLGVTQALTEFLPISSSAHLILMRSALHFDAVDGLTFDVALHVGTMLALMVYFRGDLLRLAAAFFSSIARPRLRDNVDQRIAWYIVAANVPVIVAGFLFENQIKDYARNPQVIVVTLVLGAILFLIAERLSNRARDLSSITVKDAMVIGAAQVLALIPGVSRSGITIVAGLGQRFKREEAARFSFLLAVPVLFGAGVKKTVDAVVAGSFSSGQSGVLVVGGLAAAVSGWVVVRFLMSYLRGHSLAVFAYYRLVLAAVVVAYLLLN